MHHRFTRYAKNFAIVIENFTKDPNVSIPRRPQGLGLTYGTWCILHLDLPIHPYKVN